MLDDSTVVVCDEPEDGCTAVSCDPATGTCATTPTPGEPCDDGDVCTADDVCGDDGCAGAAKDCDDSDACTADACDETSGDCTYVETDCSDDDLCTNEGCDSGTGECFSVTIGCSDSDPCTDDSCDSATGECSHVATDCDDEDACTTDSCHAVAGTCQHDEAFCNDGNLCTDDGCDAATGDCTVVPNSAACEDGNACTGNDTCSDGACAPGEPVVDCGCDTTQDCAVYEDDDLCNGSLKCSDGDCVVDETTVITCATAEEPCTENVCQPADGSCASQWVAGVSCDDGDACTVADECGESTCAGTPKACDDDGSACTAEYCDDASGDCTATVTDCGDGDLCSADECNPATGACANPDVDCQDDDLCTTDSCDEGTGECQHVPVACDDGDPCTDDACDGADGSCATTNNSAPCEDGNVCTEDDVCADGACTAGAPVVDCGCESTADCAVYEDGDLCNGTLSCEDGGCVVAVGTVVECDASEAACTVNVCAPATGVCAEQWVDEGTVCDDGLACTVEDVCDAEGTCAGADTVCPADDTECTVEACDPSTGDCVAPEIVCEADEDLCTTESCDGDTGACISTPVDCDSGDACNPTECDALTGACVAAKSPCDDDSACTTDYCRDDIPEMCSYGQVDCDDNNPCTLDTCDDELGCVYEPLLGPCTTGSDCMVSECAESATSPQSCDELGLGEGFGSADVCGASTPGDAECSGKLTHEEAVTFCADANMRLCSLSEMSNEETRATGCGYDGQQVWTSTLCLAGAYWSQKGNPGTAQPVCQPMGEAVANARCCADADIAVPQMICTPTGEAKACADDLDCTADSCDTTTSECTHTDLVCDDGAPCTIDDCEEGSGCTTTPDPCDDADPCTTDTCDDLVESCSGTVHDGSCYEVGTSPEGLSWAAAAADCTAAGGSLAVISSTEENNAVTAAVLAECGGAPTWIGLSDSALSPVFAWVDGTQPGYMNWGPGEPDGIFQDDGVVVLPDGSWADVSIVESMPCWVCETQADPCVHEEVCDDGDACTADSCDPLSGECTNVPQGCDDGLGCTDDLCDPASGECVFTDIPCDDEDLCTTDSCSEGSGCPFGVEHDGSCYELFVLDGGPGLPGPKLLIDEEGEPLTWSEARAECEALGGWLPSIHSDEENAHVRSLADEGCSNQVFIGFTDELVESSFGWLSGEPVTYTNWNLPNEPNDSGAGEDYTEMRADGLWNDISATTTRDCYICEFAPVGGCSHEPNFDCDDDDACTADTCDPATGECVNTFTGDVQCEDNDPCTVDSCEPLGGCVNADKDCDDGADCTADWCDDDNGECLHVVDCDDDNACTSDYCDELGGCGSAPLDASCCSGGPEGCVDNPPCRDCVCAADPFCCGLQWDEQCQACAAGQGPDCEQCVEACGCDQLDALDCDGDLCTTGDTCSQAACEPGLPTVCDDTGTACTVSICNPNSGNCADSTSPEHLGAAGPCCAESDDAGCGLQPCQDCVCGFDAFCCNSTWDSFCADCATGGSGFQNACDVGACQDDCECGVACDDGSPCTGDGYCHDGSCAQGVEDCDDDDPCTLDSCAADGSACVHSPAGTLVPCPDDVVLPSGSFDEADWTLVDAASVPNNGSKLTVTPDEGWLEGAAWLVARQPVALGFTATMDVVFTSTGNNNGDGMAFGIQNEAGDALGNQDGVGVNDLTIAMDSYQNSGDVSDREIEVRSNGEILAAATLPFDLAESAFTLTVVYDGAADVVVLIDGTELLAYSGLDLAASGVVDALGHAWVGFSAKTGQAHEAHEIHAFELSIDCQELACDPGVGCATGTCLAIPKSEWSCEDLGWANAGSWGSDQVCGESDIPGCIYTETHAAAEAICASQHARLCTLDELLANEPRGTGCGHDNKRNWSSTACANGGYYTTAGATNQAGSWPTQCTDPNAELVVRCCADVEPAAVEVACLPVGHGTCDDGDDCTAESCDPQAGCVSAPPGPGCGFPLSDGNCCEGGIFAPAGCSDQSCQACICDADPFCCELSWGIQCAEAATSSCWLNCVGACD